jgi:hypothetical protein
MRIMPMLEAVQIAYASRLSNSRVPPERTHSGLGRYLRWTAVYDRIDAETELAPSDDRQSNE